MKINLKDQTLEQKAYYSMPKPLHTEVRNYIVDLLNRGWLKKLLFCYASPIVTVSKKDGNLLCYRALNDKTVPDRHPIPRLQDTLESLFGNKWFSVLDQTKAYHQIYLDGESSFYNSIGIIRLNQGTIWPYQCNGRISTVYGKLSI